MTISVGEADTIIRGLYYAADYEQSIIDSMQHMKDDPEYLRATANKAVFLKLRQTLLDRRAGLHRQ